MGSTHLAAELFNTVAGIKTQQISYKGGGPAVSDLIGGHVDFILAVPVDIVHRVKAGKLRAIAVSENTRLDTLPEIPTFAEGKFPGVSLRNWQGQDGEHQSGIIARLADISRASPGVPTSAP